MVNSGFLQELVDETNNEYAGLASEEEKFAAMGFVDTGSYALNALISGSIFGGILDNKIIGYAGEEATGKTFFALSTVKRFLDTYPTGMVFYFESENALDKEEMEDRGIDTNRIAIIPVTTIEQFRTQAARILDRYDSEKESDRPRMLFVLDSLGNTSTEKEVTDVEEGNNKRDMTKQQLIRGAFRVLSLKLGKCAVPMVVTNHIYQKQGVAFGDPREMSGGGGLKYAASTILMLSKAKYKEDKEHRGAVITCTLTKSRKTREGKKVKVLLHHDKGLDKYFGLIPIAEEAGIFKKVSTRYQLPDGSKVFEKQILKDPEKYFTEEILDQIDEYTRQTFTYGSAAARHQKEDNEESSGEE